MCGVSSHDPAMCGVSSHDPTMRPAMRPAMRPGMTQRCVVCPVMIQRCVVCGVSWVMTQRCVTLYKFPLFVEHSLYLLNITHHTSCKALT